MRTSPLLLAAALAAPSLLAAQARPRAAEPTHYRLVIDPADLSGWSVEMSIRNPPRGGMRLVMAAHPEYDDRFWRYVRDLTVNSAAGPLAVVRKDSAEWVVSTSGETVVVRYRIELPPASPGARGSWTPFLAPTGGLIGGPHSFMYVLGQEAVPVQLDLQLPPRWTFAASLEPWAGSPPYVRSPHAPGFSAPDFATLMDSPILVGRLRHWRFAVGEVSHEVTYWPRPDAAAFDTAALVGALTGIVRQADALFHGLPYERFAFLLQDGAYGGLEHASSTTLGAPSEELAGDRADFLLSAAHEYFHAWNLVRLRPAGWGGLTHLPPGRTRELWWSEGVTMYYADLLLRRAGLVTTSRLDALRDQMTGYLDDPGSARVSPERASWTAEDPPGANGDVSGDHYRQGTLIATVLDLAIRDSTAGRRSLDDVMRTLVAEHPAPRGFTGLDVERAASRACGCDLHGFFERHVRGAALLDFAPGLRSLGLRPRVWMEPAVDSAGRAEPDLRVWVYVLPGETQPRFVVNDPRSAWARAGLRTGDRIVAFDGTPVDGRRAALTAIRTLHTGDRVHVDFVRGDAPMSADVVVGGYERTRVAIEDLPTVTPAQRAARARWLAATP